MDQFDPKTIGLSIGGARGVQRSIATTRYAFLRRGAGAGVRRARFVRAADLIEEYLDTRLPRGAALHGARSR